MTVGAGHPTSRTSASCLRRGDGACGQGGTGLAQSGWGLQGWPRDNPGSGEVCSCPSGLAWPSAGLQGHTRPGQGEPGARAATPGQPLRKERGQNTHNTPPLREDRVSGKEGSGGTACWEWDTPTGSRRWKSREVCRRKPLTLTQLPHHWATRA